MLQSVLAAYGEKQSREDDMTMLQSVYQDSCKGLKLDSGKKQWPLLREYIEKQLQTVSSAVVAAHINRIYLAVEEFYVNAVSYAYGEKMVLYGCTVWQMKWAV